MRTSAAISKPPEPEVLEERVLVLAPLGRDGELAAAVLTDGCVQCELCPDMETLCAEIANGAGAAMITDEALTTHTMGCLREVLEHQPAWSDLPLIIFTSQPYGGLSARSFEALGTRANATLLERPVRVKTMISAAQAALRARRRQYEVRELLDELHRRIEERDQFLAMLGHELRNPLAAITLAIESMHSQTDDATHDILTRQTKHLKKLVDDLLDIGRITSGKITLAPSEVDLADVLEHCLDAMRGRVAAHHLNLRFTRSGDAFVRGDVVRLEQVVNNLLSNAIKYTPAGGSIDVSLGRTDGDVIMRVRDSGKGIAAEMLPRVFDLFMQADVTLDRAEGGMGIGLTLVRKLVELHGGTVEAHSEGRGRGSELIVRIPAAEPSVRPAQRERSASEFAPSPARRIVVIEDNADIRGLLRIELQRLGHHVEVAEEGGAGLEKILGSRPDVALVDIGLPTLDGYEIARRVRAQLGSDIFLIALSGYGQAEDKNRAREAGFDVHLSKPAGITDLQAVLARAG